MSWERQLSTAATGNGVQAGMTLICSSEKSRLRVEVEFDFVLNRLRVSMVNGAYEYASEWLDGPQSLQLSATDQAFRLALERWLLLATYVYSTQSSRCTPLESISLLYKTLEPFLA